jgi:hypothetical protein
MDYESYLRKQRISTGRYKPTGKHRHSLPLSLVTGLSLRLHADISKATAHERIQHYVAPT